jgi:hypothetical protein
MQVVGVGSRAIVGPMSRARELAKRVLPDRFMHWYRRKRSNILEAAGGAATVTPRVLLRAFWRKTTPIRWFVRRLGKRVIPQRMVYRYRRRKITKQYLKALSYELMERGETRLGYLEGRVAARRDGFYERIVHEVLERTDIVLQELDRRIEGLRARGGQRQDAVEEQLVQLRQEVALLRRTREAGGGGARSEGNGHGSAASEVSGSVPEAAIAEEAVSGLRDDQSAPARPRGAPAPD